jgi:ABC-type bacteriocin/lantibiotic exporter with double-glycine peptidase domain
MKYSDEISPFTTDHMDKVFTELRLEYVQELLSRATHKDDIVLDIPGYRQIKSYTCGMVSGLMVLHHFNVKIDALKFHDHCRAHQTWGISTRKLANALRKLKIKVSIKKKPTFEVIADAISEGKPVITTVKRRHEIQHWIVIYGVNRKTKEIFVAGDKFWWSREPTRHKWEPYRKRFPAGSDFLICAEL